MARALDSAIGRRRRSTSSSRARPASASRAWSPRPPRSRPRAACASSSAAAPTSVTVASRTARSSRPSGRSSGRSSPRCSMPWSAARAPISRAWCRRSGGPGGVDESPQTETAPAAPVRRHPRRLPAAGRDRARRLRRRGPPLGRPGDARDDLLPHPPAPPGPRRPDHDLPLRRAAPAPSAPAVAGRARSERSRRTGRPRPTRRVGDARPARRHPRGAAVVRARRADPPTLGRQPVLRRGTARRRDRRRGRPPAADAPRGPASPGSSRCPECAQTVIGVAAVAGGRVDHDLLAQVAGLADDGPARRPARRGRAARSSSTGAGGTPAATTSSATRCSRRRPTTTSCRASGNDSIAPSPRRWRRSGPGSGAIAAGHWGELAYHWSAARDEPRAFEASVRAGEAAARAFAFADARRHDERALESWATVDDPEALAGIDRVELLGRAAEAAWLAGDARRGVALRREAVATLGPDADPIRLGGALERLGRALWVNTETEAALEAHEPAMAVMPTDPPTPELARVLSGYGQILMLLDRWTESLDLCERAVAIAREVGARQVEGHALNTLGLDLSVVGRCADSARGLGRGAGDRPRGRRRGRHRSRLRQPGGVAIRYLRRRARRGRGRPRGDRGDRRGRRHADRTAASSARTGSRMPTSWATGPRRTGWPRRASPSCRRASRCVATA